MTKSAALAAIVSSVAVIGLAGCGGGHSLDAKKELQAWWGEKRIVDSCEGTGDTWHTSTVYECQYYDPNEAGAAESRDNWGFSWDSFIKQWNVTPLCLNSFGELVELTQANVGRCT